MRGTHSSKKTLVKKPAAAPTSFDLTVIAPDLPGEGDFQFFSGLDRSEADHRKIGGQCGLLSWCAAMMTYSPTGLRLLDRAGKAGWRISMAELHHNGFHMDVPEKAIIIDHCGLDEAALGRSLYFRNAFLMTFVRALREIGHELCWGSFEENYQPEHILMLERVRAADCETVAVQVAWELRGAGFGDIWRHLLGSEDGDMAMIFARFLERDPGAHFNGSALAYAFRQWYADHDRVAACDHETLESLDDFMMEAGEALRNPFGKIELNPLNIESMGVLPDGICYLAGLGRTVMSDPFFCGMNDPVNQTHLFHLMYDLEVTLVNNVPFRDASLARRIFPGGSIFSE